MVVFGFGFGQSSANSTSKIFYNEKKTFEGKICDSSLNVITDILDLKLILPGLVAMELDFVMKQMKQIYWYMLYEVLSAYYHISVSTEACFCPPAAFQQKSEAYLLALVLLNSVC